MLVSDPVFPNPKTGRGKPTWLLLVFLLILSGAEFTVRGPLRTLGKGSAINDFLSPYVQGQAWMSGQDPYSIAVFIRLWPADAGHLGFLVNDDSLPRRNGIPSPYPLTGFPLISPLSLVRWRTAN